MTIKEIETALRESAELRDSILHETYASTVALLAVTDHEQVGSLQLAGSGTLVQVGDSLYVLTAAHVWEEVLKSASKIGITLPEDLNHRFLMDIDTIVPVGAPKLPKWTEWGPDIIFLRIPPECVVAIKPFRVFYNLSIKGPFQQQSGGLWKILVFESPSTGKIDSTATLEGVAFFQSIIDDSHCVIRCHGPETIAATAPK